MSEANLKKKLLIFSEFYLPGYKSGGGMRTIVNIVAHLKDRFDFFIITTDRDGKNDNTIYENVDFNNWNEVQGAKVFYLNKKQIKSEKILELYNEVKPDVLYSNSYFSAFGRHLLLLKKLGKVKNLNYIISPCGELSEGSFKMGRFKKMMYVNLARILNLHKNVIWKASTEVEKKQIEQFLGEQKHIFIAPDLIPKVFLEDFDPSEKPLKKPGYVKMIFLSRFYQKKNFKFLLENVKAIKGNVEIDMIGPIVDEKYLQECMDLIAELPENIEVRIKKSIPHSDVIKTLKNYHFFVLPTLHENFGHIFLEAFSAGCPIIISDRTPWLNLEEKNVGWSIPLENSEKWRGTLQECVEMDQNHYSDLSQNARKFVEEWIRENDLEKDTLKLFNFALSNTLS